MKKNLNRILLSCLGLSTICIVSLIFYRVSIDIDQTNCIERLSLQFGVAPIDEEVYDALHRELNQRLPIGLSYVETFLILDKSWDYHIIRRYEGEAGYSEYVRLDNCNYSMNDYKFLFSYSEDDKLTKIRKYIDD